MKKIQVIFAAAAILFAVAGAFASKLSADVFYRAADANFGVISTADCSEIVSLPCTESTNTRCTDQFFTQLPEDEEPVERTYSISKQINGSGDCLVVKKP